ncbi:hypothetical protein ACFL59_16460 [Planctomycetota bacterium]
MSDKVDSDKQTELPPPCACDAVEDLQPCVKDYLIPEEIRALAAMRRIRDKSLPVRAELRRLRGTAGTARRPALAETLETLRQQYRQARKDLDVANNVKMKWLGHTE